MAANKPTARRRYGVAVIDPPWPMKKIVRRCATNQTANLDYGTQTLPDISSAIKKSILPCLKKSAHVFLWTTHKYLPAALKLLEDWDLKYVCIFVWHKPGGFQPYNLPQYNCEFVIYARKGTPTFTNTKAFPVCFDAPRNGHSAKPEEFYSMLRRVTASPRIDVYNRRKIAGFDTWGNEAK